MKGVQDWRYLEAVTEMATSWRQIASPVGSLLLIARADGLTGVWFETSRHARPTMPNEPNAADARAEDIMDDAARQLDAYFAGKRRTFDLPLQPDGTPFQQRVWTALRAIP